MLFGLYRMKDISPGFLREYSAASSPPLFQMVTSICIHGRITKRTSTAEFEVLGTQTSQSIATAESPWNIWVVSSPWSVSCCLRTLLTLGFFFLLGPKTYSFTSSADLGASINNDKSILKVRTHVSVSLSLSNYIHIGELLIMQFPYIRLFLHSAVLVQLLPVFL